MSPHNGKQQQQVYPVSSHMQSQQVKRPAPAKNGQRQTMRPFDTDTHSPTHDALSRIYNNGY